jgi:hypothetical protein
MKRISAVVTCCLLTFTCGVAVASFRNWISYPVKNEQRSTKTVERPATETDFAASPEISPSTPTAVHEGVFLIDAYGSVSVRIVREEVHLKSERLRYEIDVNYPQIVGSDDPRIRKLNQRIKRLAIENYEWPLSPSKADLRNYKVKHPEAFNSIELDYNIFFSLHYPLSIYFNVYSYGIGAAHSVQYSFVINYDFVLQRELKLADLFTRHSKYLEFMSRYCKDELSKRGEYMFEEKLKPVAENFDSWNITRAGLRFNFDACSVSACAGGPQTVEIPFDVLKPFLSETRK